MDTNLLAQIARLSDRELIEKVGQLARREQEATATLVAHLAELEKRDLHLAEGCSSLFTYCVQVLHLSEHAAYNRIEVARAARKFPIILEELAAGHVHLTAVRLIAPHLNEKNHRFLLEAARHRSRREVEEFLVSIRPLPPVRPMVRRLPRAGGDGGQNAAMQENVELPIRADSAAGGEGQMEKFDATKMGNSAASNMSETGEPKDEMGSLLATVSVPSRPARPAVTPVSADIYKIQFAARAETREKLREAQELLRHQVPNGDVSEIMDRALTLLVERLRKQKFAAVRREKPRRVSRAENVAITDAAPAAVEDGVSAAIVDAVPAGIEDAVPERSSANVAGTRWIPSAVKREVWRRDRGRCAFRAPDGRRCTERGKLEFHHVQPFALAGAAEVENIELRCRAHNSYESRLWFGRKAVVGWRGAQTRPQNTGGPRRTRSGTSSSDTSSHRRSASSEPGFW